LEVLTVDEGFNAWVRQILKEGEGVEEGEGCGTIDTDCISNGADAKFAGYDGFNAGAVRFVVSNGLEKERGINRRSDETVSNKHLSK
jgi:hypothetical protein